MEEKRNKWVCIGLCCGAFICIGGLHDFYLKRWGWGIIKLLTFDFLWIGAIYDIYKMLTDNYSDNIKTKKMATFLGYESIWLNGQKWILEHSHALF